MTIKLSMLLQKDTDVFGQLRIENWRGSGFLTLTPVEAQTIAAIMILGARASGDEIIYEEHIFERGRSPSDVLVPAGPGEWPVTQEAT